MSDEAELMADLSAAIPGGDEEFEIRLLLAWKLLERDDLSEAAAQAERVLDAVPGDHWLAAAGHAVTGHVLAARLNGSSDQSKADQAIEHLRAAVAAPGADLVPPELPALLGWLLLRRFWQSPSSAAGEEDLSRAIAILAHTVDSPELDEESIAEAVALSGLGLAHRHWLATAAGDEEEEADLNAAIPLLIRANEYSPDDAEITDTLQELRAERYLQSPDGGSEDLHAAVSCLEGWHSDPPEGMDRDWINFELAGALVAQANRGLASLGVYNRAVELLTEIIARLPAGDPRRLWAVIRLSAYSFVSEVPYTEAMDVRLRRTISLAREELACQSADPEDEGALRFILGIALVSYWEGHRSDTIRVEAQEELLRALDLIPADDPIRIQASQMSGTLTFSHGMIAGDLHSVDRARAVFRSIARPFGRHAQPTVDPYTAELDANALAADVWADVTRYDLSRLGVQRRNLRRAVARMSPQARTGSFAENALAFAEVLAMAQGGDSSSNLTIEVLISRLANAANAATNDIERTSLGCLKGLLQFIRSVLGGDRTAALQGLDALANAMSIGGFDQFGPATQLSLLGAGHFISYEQWGDPTDLDQAINYLDQAREQAADDTTPAHIQVLLMLAKAYRRSATSRPELRQRAVEMGRDALLARARGVLLQTGAEHGQAAARHGADEALNIARWCLADREPSEAVAALELGRGLVLHAATVTADVPALLREAGSAALAEQWERASGALHEPPLTVPVDSPGALVQLLQASAPSDLRKQVLQTLRGTAAETQLLSQPSPQDIGRALRSRGIDALTYLLPSAGESPGRAVVVWADGEVGEVVLHLLDDCSGPISSYVDAYRKARKTASGSPDRERSPAIWRGRLRALCSWAWKAAMSQLIAVARKRADVPEPRLVLVPFGPLGVVPWHAACREGRRVRYACEEAVVSYAASARQFIEAAARSSRPPAEAPVFVANPTGDLKFAELEATAICDACYPGAVYLGRPLERAAGHGVPTEVLRRLPSTAGPGASLLHLGCHARAEDTPARSYLMLAGGQPLPIERVLSQAAQRRVDGSGALIVLGACESDFSTEDHDEPLTLASAFLAAGAASVVGSRWIVSDGRTALLMFMFHHYLAAGSPPMEALHTAQRWMLNPDGAVLDTMPDDLAACTTTYDLTDPYAFAAFTHQGR